HRRAQSCRAGRILLPSTNLPNGASRASAERHGHERSGAGRTSRPAHSEPTDIITKEGSGASARSDHLFEADAECAANGAQCFQRYVRTAALDPAQIRSLNIATVGQLLHRHPSLLSQLSDSCRDVCDFLFVAHRCVENTHYILQCKYFYINPHYAYHMK